VRHAGAHVDEVELGRKGVAAKALQAGAGYGPIPYDTIEAVVLGANDLSRQQCLLT
jgi:hypothetical protein